MNSKDITALALVLHAIKSQREAKGVTPGVPQTREQMELVNTAMEMDRLAQSIVESAKHLSERFARWADEVAEHGGFYSLENTPHAYSGLRDTERMSAKLSALQEPFRAQFRAVTGETVGRAYRALEANKSVSEVSQ